MIKIDQSQWTYYSKPIQFPSTHPVENLALEQCLFEQYEPGHPSILVFYSNDGSVVIGKHQNPWYEADTQWIEQEQIPLIRRMSGGGTVVHDLGNLNYSFLCDKKTFDQRTNLEFLIYVLTSLGVEDLSITDRGDLLLQGYKISGNAMWYKKETVLHHGTLLFNSDLKRLGRALQGLKNQSTFQFQGHWVDSKPWSVGNIQDFYGHIDPTTMVSLVQRLVGSQQSSLTLGLLGSTRFNSLEEYLIGLKESPRFYDLVGQYQSWEWNFAKTPRFQCGLSGNNPDKWLVIDQGMIQNQRGDGQDLVRFLGLPSLKRVFLNN